MMAIGAALAAWGPREPAGPANAVGASLVLGGLGMAVGCCFYVRCQSHRLAAVVRELLATEADVEQLADAARRIEQRDDGLSLQAYAAFGLAAAWVLLMAAGQLRAWTALSPPVILLLSAAITVGVTVVTFFQCVIWLTAPSDGDVRRLRDATRPVLKAREAAAEQAARDENRHQRAEEQERREAVEAEDASRRQAAERTRILASLPPSVRAAESEAEALALGGLAEKLTLALAYDGADDRVRLPDGAYDAVGELLGRKDADAHARHCLEAYARLARVTGQRAASALREATEDGRVDPPPPSLQEASPEQTEWIRFFLEEARRRLPGVLSALESRDPGVRLAACESTVAALDARAVAPLARILADDTAFGLRTAAAWALGRIGSPDALPHLRRALQQEEPDWEASGVTMFGELAADRDVVQEAIDRIESGDVARFLSVVL